jgi:hypothetical protein
MESSPAGILLRTPEHGRTLLLLSGLRLDHCDEMRTATPVGEPSTEAQGRAEYYGRRLANGTPEEADSGRWHVQCVDRETTVAEHEIFSDEENAPREAPTSSGEPGFGAT